MITIFVTTMQIRCKVGQVPCLHQQTFCWFNKSENEVNSATPCVCLRECESSRFTLYKAGVGGTCFRVHVFTMMILMTMMTMFMMTMLMMAMMNVMMMMRVRCHWMQISKARRQKLRPRFESINMRTEQALVQIHKYKFTNKKNGPAMLQVHQYAHCSSSIEVQLHCKYKLQIHLQKILVYTQKETKLFVLLCKYSANAECLIMQIHSKCNFQTLCLDDVCRSR